MARRLGASEEWIAAVRTETPEAADTGTGCLEGMEDSWLTALRYAEKVNESGHSVTDDDYAELSRHWSETEVLEITLVIGLFAYFNRVNDALRVEVTK